MKIWDKEEDANVLLILIKKKNAVHVEEGCPHVEAYLSNPSYQLESATAWFKPEEGTMEESIVEKDPRN